MATVERGKAKGRQFIEIVREGVVLRRQETEGTEAHLPGYRRCASETAAATTLAAEVRALLADGMRPADDEARAIAARAAPSAPALPLRCDLGIYNEATGFVVTSRKMAGKTLEEGSPAWLKAVKRGDMLPLQLVQDDSFVIRIVAGAALSAQEAEEWVARVDWHLNVPDGKLCVTGGAPFTNEDYDADDGYWAQFVGEVAIPKGRYQASLYTYLHGVNGDSVIDHLAGGDEGERLEDWLARTRPGVALPEWDEAREPVAFLLHLEPVDAAPTAAGLSQLPDAGWFEGTENARRPERCPLGIAAQDVVRRPDAESGAWTYVRDVFPLVAQKWKSDPAALEGGETASLPVERVSRAVRIAWFPVQAVIELRVKPPAGASVDLGGAWPDGVIAVEENGVLRVLFSADLDPSAALARAGELGPRLAAMPDGTVLDLCAAPYEHAAGDAARPGYLWLRGPLRAGRWRIARAHPTASKEALEGALALAAEVEGTTIAVRDAAEGEAILARAKRTLGSLLDRNPPQLRAGAFRFEKPGETVGLLGTAVFAERFGSTWPVHETDAPHTDAGDEDDDGLFDTVPIEGALIRTAASGRAWHQTMALLLSMKIDQAVRQREKGLRAAGFRAGGDLMTPAMKDVAFHGYVRGDGRAVAWFRVSYPDSVAFEVASFFAGGAVLLTSEDPGAADDVPRNVYAQGLPGASSAELVAQHDRRAQELAASLGEPTPIDVSIHALAEALERVVPH